MAGCISAELLQLLCDFEEKVEFAVAMISGHEVKAVLSSPRRKAHHLYECLWTTTLADGLEEARAAVLARIVHQSHSCVLVFKGENLWFGRGKIA